MALPAADTFTTDSPDKALTTYSANWTLNNGNFLVNYSGDTCGANALDAECGAHWNADSFNDAQYSWATLAVNSVGTNYAIGVSVRCDTGGDDYFYGFYLNVGGNDHFTYEVVNGAWNQLGTDSYTDAPGDVIYLEIDGSDNITSKINAGTVYGPTSDDTIASGSAGLSGYNNAYSTCNVTDWEGGNLGVATPAVSESDALTIGESIGADLTIGVGIEMDGAGYQGTGVRVR